MKTSDTVQILSLSDLHHDTLRVNFNGVGMTVASNHAPLLDYLRRHLHHLVVEEHTQPASLLVRAFWLHGPWDPEQHPFPVAAPLKRLGKRMLGNERELIWFNTLKMKGLQLRFERDGASWVFDVAYFFNPKREKLERLPEYEVKKYFSLASYIIYYPAMWYLARSRGWVPLHASALLSDKGAVLIGGLGGVGKTTTCVALMQHAGMPLISENLVFTDGDWIYPCYEPIRLTEESLAMLRGCQTRLHPMDFPEGLKDKELYHIVQNDLPERTRPAVCFLPVFSEKRYVMPLAPEIALEKIQAMNRLTRELDDFYWYAAALQMHWPRANLTNVQFQTIAQCIDNMPCFELGIDRRLGVTAVVQDIVETLESC